jgi:hypothetical protein
MQLYDLVHDVHGHPKPLWKISRIENEYLKILSVKRDDKSLKRVENIKLRIANDLNKNCFDKKYQIQCFNEYNVLKEFCETIDMKAYELLWHHDGKGVKRNQLYKIIEGDYFCCKDCDRPSEGRSVVQMTTRPMTFISRQVPVKYCYLSKVE